ncbi:MAG: InlB B-repeat-containing protein [Bacilli bacterium]|jgi:uncharacterized repeat protein (TIGR02543 family)
MHEDLMTKKNRKFLLFTTICLVSSVAVFAIARNSQSLKQLIYGEGPIYTITLNEANTPASLSTDQYGSGEGFARYVEFNYTNAKRATGQHVVLGEDGTLINSPDTRITSIKSFVVTFSGGEATLLNGPTVSTLGNSQVLTSGTTVYFTTDPYFFSLANSGSGDLTITSLILTYSCVHTHSTITFDTERGSAVDPLTQTIGSEVVVPSEPTRTGYLFDGWYSDEGLTAEYTFSVMPDTDFTLYAKWAIDPAYPVLSIAQFKALSPEDTNLHFVSGTTLVSSSEMEITIICDASDTVIAFGFQQAEVGDSVRVGGYLAVEEGLIVINGDLIYGISVDIYSRNNDILLAPSVMSVASYNALNPESPSNWVVYAEINGTIIMDYDTHIITLVDGEESLPIGVFGQESYEYIKDYNGFRVNIRGVILPNMDEEVTTLMLIYNGHEDFINLDYDGEGGDEELLTLLESMFRSAFESPTYFPGQFVDLPAEHAIVPITLVYEPFGTYASQYNIETKRISDDVASEIYIDVHVHATLHETVNETFDIQLHVDPDIIITIAELKLLPDSDEETLVIQCVVLNSQSMNENFMLLVADETGIIYINTDDGSIAPGDEVIALGYKMTQNSIVFLFNDPHSTVDQVVATGQSMPITATQISLAGFIALDHEDVGSDFRYYELFGTLSYINPSNPDESLFVLTYGTDNVYIYPTSQASRGILNSLVSQEITVRGIAMLGGEPGNQIVMLGFLPIS